MKYVVFKFASIYVPIMLPEQATHSQVKLLEGKPVSAGFFHIKGGSVHVTNEKSVSLKLGPHKRDEKLLQMAIDNYGTSSFLIEYNK